MEPATLKIAQATNADTDAVVAILSDAARWLQSRNLPTWDPPTLPHVMGAAISRGEVYLARIEDQPIATVSVQWSDTLYWGEQPDDAGYIHKLAVVRSAGGQGVGAKVLAWAENFIVARRRQFARLDCHADNPTINRMYEQAGYQLRGTLIVNDTRMNIREKCLA